MADGPSSQATASGSSASDLSGAALCLPLVPGPDGEEELDELPEGAIECSICLQSCIHPVQLPCSHIFCFLCVKGVANHSKRCALCRSEIPPEFLLRPMLLNTDEVLQTQAFDGKYQWFYEGVRGWWQYDVRASLEIEDRYQKGEQVFEMLIAGFLYVVDMENMVQYRRNTPSRRRRIKRDLVDIPDKKGVAGLSCRRRPPKRTGGDGGEREVTSGVAGSSGGGTGLASTAGVAADAAGATDSAQVSSVQLQMKNLTLTDADDRADGNPQRSRNARSAGSRLAATDGVDRAAGGIRANSRAADGITAHHPNPASRSNRGSRRAADASAKGQPNQDARVNRVSPQSVDMATNGQPNQDARVNRVSPQSVDMATNSQPNQDASINHVNSQAVEATAANSQSSTGSRVNRVDSDGHDGTTSGQQSSLSSRGNRVNSDGVDMTTNRQQVEVTTNDQPSLGVGGNQVNNHAVANRANQPVVNVVENCVNAEANEPAMLDQVGQARLPGLARGRIEGNDRMDRVDGSSDSD